MLRASLLGAACLGAAILTCGSPAGATVNLVTNGSFETPAVTGSANYTNHEVGASTLTGWTIVGPAGEAVSQVNSAFAGNPGYTFPAEDGDVWLDLAGFVSNSPTGVSQSIATAIDESYLLSFWIGNVSGGPFGTDTTVDVEFSSGGTNFSCTNSIAGVVLAWQQCTGIFTADSATTSITLRSADPSTDFSAAIDNVSVTQIVPGVPEPASWMLMIAGFGLAGGMARRRCAHRPVFAAR